MNSFSVRRKSLIMFLVLVILLFMGIDTSYSQLKEPEVRKNNQPRTPLTEGFRNSWSIDVVINNFGFGLGGQYTRVTGPYTEFIFKTGITGIRDASEQSFQDFFSGQRLIPNKFNRALGFPFLFGIKRRIFADEVDDNFRFFLSGSAGPALAFVYPYLNDIDGNGFRTVAPMNGQLVPVEPVNDFFSGLGQGDTKWGASGEIKIGIEFGEDFDHPTTLEFGYFFYFFNQGLQIMEPFRPQTNDNGQIVINPDGTIPRESFFDKQKHFGTPQITVTFGGMW